MTVHVALHRTVVYMDNCCYELYDTTLCSKDIYYKVILNLLYAYFKKVYQRLHKINDFRMTMIKWVINLIHAQSV